MLSVSVPSADGGVEEPTPTTRRRRQRKEAEEDEETGRKKPKTAETEMTIGQLLRRHTRSQQMWTPVPAWEASPLWTSLNSRQQKVLYRLKAGEHVFVTGPGGTGKSQIIKCLTYLFGLLQKQVVVTAPTGTAAVQINGTTLHSFMGLGLMKESVPELLKRVRANKFIQSRWNNVDILVIDEVSLLERAFLDKVDTLLRIVRSCPDKPMGGIQMLFVGDFFQLQPRSDFCFRSKAWKELQPQWVTFSHNYRQSGDQTFQQILGRVRCGIPRRRDIELLKARLLTNDPEMPPNHNPDLIPTILCSTNAEAGRINDAKFRQLEERGLGQAETTLLFRAHTTQPPHASAGNLARIDRLIEHLNVPEELRLRVGAQVMLTINLSVSEGLANGSFGTIVDFETAMPHNPIIRFQNGLVRMMTAHEWKFPLNPKAAKAKASDLKETIQDMTDAFNRPNNFANMARGVAEYVAEAEAEAEEEGFSELVVHRQFPLRLAWAITIHKSQGMTLDFVQIAITKNFFSCGQSYTALSRCRALKSLLLTELHEPMLCKSHSLVQRMYIAHHNRSRRDFLSCAEADGPVRRFVTHPRFDPNTFLLIFDACQ